MRATSASIRNTCDQSPNLNRPSAPFTSEFMARSIFNRAARRFVRFMPGSTVHVPLAVIVPLACRRWLRCSSNRVAL